MHSFSGNNSSSVTLSTIQLFFAAALATGIALSDICRRDFAENFGVVNFINSSDSCEEGILHFSKSKNSNIAAVVVKAIVFQSSAGGSIRVCPGTDTSVTNPFESHALNVIMAFFQGR